MRQQRVYDPEQRFDSSQNNVNKLYDVPKRGSADIDSASKIEEQKAIAEILSDMDAEITALEERLEKAKAIKQGMMQQLLTGKIRLVD